MLPFQVRPLKTSDRDFIFGAWLESYRYGPMSLTLELNGKKLSLLDSEIYYRNYRKQIDKILNASEVDVLCNTEDENHVFGFACHRDITIGVKALSYIYIKQPYRKMGLSKVLLEKLNGHSIIATHAKQNVVKFIKKNGMIYNPFLDWSL